MSGARHDNRFKPERERLQTFLPRLITAVGNLREIGVDSEKEGDLQTISIESKTIKPQEGNQRRLSSSFIPTRNA